MARIARWLPALAVCAVILLPDQGWAQQEHVYKISELTELPKIKSAKQAQETIDRSYPRVLRDQSVGGKVRLQFVVTSSGKVDPESVVVLAATVGALGDAAAAAVKAIEFVPGKKDGTAVSSMVVIPISYGG